MFTPNHPRSAINWSNPTGGQFVTSALNLLTWEFFSFRYSFRVIFFVLFTIFLRSARTRLLFVTWPESSILSSVKWQMWLWWWRRDCDLGFGTENKGYQNLTLECVLQRKLTSRNFDQSKSKQPKRRTQVTFNTILLTPIVWQHIHGKHITR